MALTARDGTGPRPLVKVVLLTKDEHDLIEDFLTFYTGLFGDENVVVIDNCSTDPSVLETYARFRARGVQVHTEAGNFRDAVHFMSVHMARLAAAPDAPTFLLPLETDEFLFLPEQAADVAVSADAVRAALLAIPPDVTVVRYAKFLGSVVNPEADPSGYEDGRYSRPARQMSTFYDQGWDKLIVRADAFVRMSQWCHHAQVSYGREATCGALGLLHFHEAGFHRQVERALPVMRAYGHIDLTAPLHEQLVQAAAINRSSAACGHKVRYYDVLLRRRAVLHAFRDLAVQRLPTRAEMDAYCNHDPLMEGGGPAAAVRADAAKLRAEGSSASTQTSWRSLLYGDYGAALTCGGRPLTAPLARISQVSAALLQVARHPIRNSDATPPSFAQVLARYASHHNESGTDKSTSHSYGELYSRLFAPLRETASAVLEMGIYSGASCAALADYFTRAHVTGLDITLERLKFGTDHPRIQFRQLSCTAACTPRVLGGTWDVILDDASHDPADQLASFKLFAPCLRAGGLYIIEDISGQHEGGAWLRAGLTAACAEVGFQTPIEWHDLRHLRGQFDDIVAVMRPRDDAGRRGA